MNKEFRHFGSHFWCGLYLFIITCVHAWFDLKRGYLYEQRIRHSWNTGLLCSAVPCRRLDGLLPPQNHRRKLHNGGKPQRTLLGHGRWLGERESRLQARAKQSSLYLVAQAVQTLVGRRLPEKGPEPWICVDRAWCRLSNGSGGGRSSSLVAPRGNRRAPSASRSQKE